MGILRGALNGLGKGLVVKAALDWDRIKQESEVESRKALVELESQHANQRLDREIEAGDARSQRETQARKDLATQELDARATEGKADRQSREKIASEGNAAAIEAAGLRAAGRAGSKIIGHDADGNPIYGSDDGDFKSAIVKEPLMRVERGPDGKLREVPVLDENNQPVMRERLVKFSGKSGANYSDGEDGVEVSDDQLGALNAKPEPSAATAPSSTPKGGVLNRAAAMQPKPQPKASNPTQEIANLKGELERLTFFQDGADQSEKFAMEKRRVEIQNRLRDLGVK